MPKNSTTISPQSEIPCPLNMARELLEVFLRNFTYSLYIIYTMNRFSLFSDNL